jgi:ubiquinone/menaquinone biosynthesis C-methylase UbiE
VTEGPDGLIQRSGYAREGFAARYDDYRPRPPDLLLDVLCRTARVERPGLVVDIGCGTGLSTRPWAGRARRVLGIEPNPAMLAEAGARTDAPNVEFVEGFAGATGVDDGAADLVTCSQSLHWMEPETTFAEAARILRPGGVFAAYDYDLPPVVDPDADAAFERYLAERRQARQREGVSVGADRWPKHEHLERIRASGRFRYARELVLGGTTEGGAADLVGLALSIGPELGETARAIEALRAELESRLGDRVVPWLVGYRVRLGIR